jgi:hypothetical protein
MSEMSISEIIKETMSEMSISEIIKLLEELKQRADYRSRIITENGRERTDLERAVSAATADAYAFCIMLLKDTVP